MTEPTGFSSEIGTKLRDWAVGQDGGSCYSRAALSSNDSKTRYVWVNGQIRLLEETADPPLFPLTLPSFLPFEGLAFGGGSKIVQKP